MFGKLLLHIVTLGKILKLTGAFMRETGARLCQGKDDREGEGAEETEEEGDVPR